MKKKLVACRDCGYEEKREVYDREDAERRNLQLVSPKCKKCGSANVKLCD